MPEVAVDFSTGFENYLMGALLYRNVAFSTSVTFTPGISLNLQDGLAYVYYKLGPTNTIRTSFAFRIERNQSSSNYRAELCDVASENAIPGLYAGQVATRYWFGSRWFVNADMNLGAVATNGFGGGRTNYGIGDLVTPPSDGENIKTLFTDIQIAESTWYWLDTETTVDFSVVVISGANNYIVTSSTTGKLNGVQLDTVSVQKRNPQGVQSMVNNGISFYPTVLKLLGNFYWNIYFDNVTTGWPGEGVSNG